MDKADKLVLSVCSIVLLFVNLVFLFVKVYDNSVYTFVTMFGIDSIAILITIWRTELNT